MHDCPISLLLDLWYKPRSLPKDYKDCRVISYRKPDMKEATVVLFLAFVLLLAGFSSPPAFAHNSIQSGDIQVEGGWLTEPALAGQLNGIILTITKISDGQPITNALAQADVSITKGGASKSLEFQPQEEPGVYVAAIIPTSTGQYAISFKGSVAGQAFDEQIPIENVDSTRSVEFPQTGGGSGGNSSIPQEVINQLQNVIADLATQVDQANLAADDARTAADKATKSSTDLALSADRAYVFGMVGVGVGVAGIVIGVTALSRKSKE